MNTNLPLASLLVLTSFLFPSPAGAHGGVYLGPGDTVPPGGGGVGGNGPAPSTPGGPGPGSTGTGGPGAPGTGQPGSTGTGTTGQPGRPSTGQPGGDADLTTWEYWWFFNQAPFLNLKRALYEGLGTDGGVDLGDDCTSISKTTMRPSEKDIREKIVPALRAALANERSNDIVTGALIALARIGDVRGEDGLSESEPLIRPFLADSNQEIAETAAIALGILAHDGSVATLEHLVRDDEEGRKRVRSTEVPYRTRAFAAYGLGLIGARTGSEEVRSAVARVLFEVLGGPATSTRDVAVACVSALGIVPLRIAAQGEGEAGPADSRQGQIAALERIYRDERIQPLVRAHVPTALARLCQADARALPPDVRARVVRLVLGTLARHSGALPVLQQSAVLALGQLCDTDRDELDLAARTRLVELVDDARDNQTRHFACIALGQIGARRGAGAEDERGVRTLRTFLAEKLVRGSTHVRPWVGLAIGIMERSIEDLPTAGGVVPSPAQREALRAALGSTRSQTEQGAYAIACGIARDHDARTVLKRLSTDAGKEVQGHIAIARGLINDRAAIPDLLAVVRKARFEPELLRDAAVGLALLGEKQIVPELCTLLGEARSLSSQAALAAALGLIGDSRSIDLLVAMLRKTEGLTGAARGFAAVAIGIVADKELLPWNAKFSVDINYRANTTTLTGAGGTGILDLL